MFNFSKSKKDFELTFKKRHLIFLLVIIGIGLFGYSLYFRFFMVLPQSAFFILPELPISLDNQKILILSPHCDDETLGAGGLIQRALSKNSKVKVVIITDCNKRKKGNLRKKETLKALDILGVKKDNVLFLNFPELGIETSQKEAELSQRLREEIKIFSPSLIVSPHLEDTHPDHKVVGKVVSELTKYKNIQIIYYLIHYNFLKFPSPSGFKPNYYILPPARLIKFKERWYKFSLAEEEEERKERAVFVYRTQLSYKNPILRRLLFGFIRRNELFMVKY